MKRIGIGLIALIWAVFYCSARNEANSIPLWPNDVPGITKAKQGNVYDKTREKGTILALEVTNPSLLIFPPKGHDNNVGVIVNPGGGYAILAYDKEGTEIAQWLANQGYTAFVLSYRIPNQRSEAIMDLQRAIRVVHSHYASLKQVGVIGFSAGASLSARAATRFDQPSYTAIDATDSLSCRPDFAMLIYPAYLDEGTNYALTPELTLSKATPPMFIFATADDPYSNSALVMATALRSNKTPVELHLYPQGGHGYGLRKGAGKIWPGLASTWLKTNILNK